MSILKCLCGRAEAYPSTARSQITLVIFIFYFLPPHYEEQSSSVVSQHWNVTCQRNRYVFWSMDTPCLNSTSCSPSALLFQCDVFKSVEREHLVLFATDLEEEKAKLHECCVRCSSLFVCIREVHDSSSQ